MSDRTNPDRDRAAGSEQYKAIFEATSDGLVINDPETGLVLEANPAFCRMHGYDQMVGMHPREFTPPDTRYLFEDYVRAAAAGGQLRWRCRHTRRDGASFDVEVIGRGFTYRGKPALLGVVRDVSEQVRGEQLLEDRVEERTSELRTLLDVSSQIAGTLELEDLLALVVERLPSVMDCVASGIAVLEDDSLVLVASRSGQKHNAALGVRVPLSQIRDIWDIISKGGDVIVDDICDESEAAACYRGAGWDIRQHEGFGDVRAWMAVPLQHKDRVIGLLAVSSDRKGFYTAEQARLARALAGQVAAAIENARLYESTAERTRELSTLLHVSRKVASTLDLDELLCVILEQIQVIGEYDRASFSVREGHTLEVRSIIWSGERQLGLPKGARVDLRAAPDFWRQAESGEPAIIDDVCDDSDLSQQYRRAGGSTDGIRSWMGIPLMSRGEFTGLLALAKSERGFFSAQQARLARAFADQAAIAIDNARLFEEAERRTRETTGLLEVSRTVASSLDLSEVLGAILDQLGAITQHTGSSIMLIADDALELAAARSITGTAPTGARIPFTVRTGLAGAISGGEIVIIDDIRADEPFADDYRAAIRSIGVLDQPPFDVIRSWMSVPLALKDRVLGALTMSWTEPGYFTADHARLARAFADQASIAIENARAYEQAQQLAASEERQRLARELHDSVSQAIYGIALGARTARTLQDRNPADAVEPMEYVISLAEAALAEMRALIFELRPESLANEGLVAAISKRVEATGMRYGIAVDWNPPDEPDVSLAAKEATYRVIQEALHNIVKHSKATRAGVALKADPEALSFRVSDNGVGFDPGQSFSGHLGLQSMRERLQGLGGVLQIESAPNSGTSVNGSIPLT